MRIGLISDTHDYLNGRVFHLFADVQLILHAGDVGEDSILLDLAEIAPVHAVSGNCDGTPTKAKPMRFAQEISGIKICMTHGHLLDPGDYNTSAQKFFEGENPRIILHGHSHIAKHETAGEVHIINPGAACRPRFRDVPSVAVLEINTDGTFTCIFHKL